MSKKKVLILLRSLDVLGGTEIQTLNLAKALVQADMEVTLVLYFGANPQLSTFFVQEGVAVRDLAIDPQKGLLKTFLSILSFLRATNSDIVHVQYMNPGLIPIIAAKLAAVPVLIGQIHQPATYYKTIHKWLVNLAAFLCDYFISVSLNTQKSWFNKQVLYQKGNKMPKNSTMYNSLYHVFQADQARLLLRSQDPILRIAVVGRLRWEKGQRFAIEAFAKLTRVHSACHLHVVGIGEDEPMLRDLVQELSIADRVTFHGQLLPQELNTLYHQIHLMIVPSQYEAFGLTAIEAMNYQIPVIASAVDGLQEVVSDGENGFLVPFGDAESIADRLSILARDPQLRKDMGKKGEESVEKKFSFLQFQGLVNDFYSRL